MIHFGFPTYRAHFNSKNHLMTRSTFPSPSLYPLTTDLLLAFFVADPSITVGHASAGGIV